jgi:hypothetical protein
MLLQPNIYRTNALGCQTEGNPTYAAIEKTFGKQSDHGKKK